MSTKASKLFTTLILLSVFLLSLQVGVVLANHRTFGSGTCWSSGPAWQYHHADYVVGGSIPSSWVAPIVNSASTWANVTTSSFYFTKVTSGNSSIGKGAIPDPSFIAVTTIYGNPTITRVTTVFDYTDPWDPNFPPASNKYGVHNVMTHEFGHWLDLNDQYGGSCTEVTMYGYIALGETKKQTLETADRDGISWQYP